VSAKELLPEKARAPRHSRAYENIFPLRRERFPWCSSWAIRRALAQLLSCRRPQTCTLSPPQESGFFVSSGKLLRRRPQAAFFTRPERIQEVQTRMCLCVPLITVLTRRRFGFQRRRVTL